MLIHTVPTGLSGEPPEGPAIPVTLNPMLAPVRCLIPCDISNAVASLTKGEFTKTPVQTAAGWHVIQLMGMRDKAPPAFDDVKDRLGKIVVSKKFKLHSDEMLKTAKIDPPLATKEAPAPAAPASTPAPAPAPAPAN